MKKKSIGTILVIIIAVGLFAGCGERIEVNSAEEINEFEVETGQADKEPETRVEASEVISQKDSSSPQSSDDDSYYKGSEQLPEEIIKQIEIYVNQREVWLPKP